MSITRIHYVWCFSAVLSILLAACGGAITAEPTEPLEEPLKVALLLATSRTSDDWAGRGYKGLELVASEFGAQTAFTENMGAPEMEAAFRDYASQGYDIVIGHSFGFGDAALAAAADFPDTYYVVNAGAHAAENVASVAVDEQENHYLAGALAALVSETGKIGFIGGFDYPAVIKELVGYMEGAKAVNSDIDVRVAWVGSWGDPVKAQELAVAMLEDGVDVILEQSGASAPGINRALQDYGGWLIRCIGTCMESMPDICLTSVDAIWEEAIRKVVELFLEGKLEGRIYEWGIEEGVVDLGPINENIPQEYVDQVMELRSQIIEGTLVVTPKYELPEQ